MKTFALIAVVLVAGSISLAQNRLGPPERIRQRLAEADTQNAQTQPAQTQPAATDWKDSTAEPAGLGLQARLVVKQDTYKLDEQLKKFDFAAWAENTDRRSQPPKTPAVDLVLEIRNNGDKPVTFNVGADVEQITLKLEGPGAVSGQTPAMMTREFRLGKAHTLNSGQVLELPIKRLSYGMRGVSQGAWWTKPGQYTISASYRNTLGDAAPAVGEAKPFTVTTGKATLKVVDESDQAPAAATDWKDSKADPKDIGLQARLVVKQDAYKLDERLKKFDFAAWAKNKEFDKPQPPKTPEVDLVLEVRNSGDKPVKFNVGGDSEQIVLTLEGPGAYSGSLQMMMTMEYRIGKSRTLNSGEVLELPIKRLSYGARGISHGAWWSKPGKYTISASYRNQPFTVTTGEATLKVVDDAQGETKPAAEETQPEPSRPTPNRLRERLMVQ